MKKSKSKPQKTSRTMVASKSTRKPDSPSMDGEEGSRAESERSEKQGGKAPKVCTYEQAD